MSKFDTEHRSIAIVGIGCRFPGEIGSSRQFWEFLKEGRDAIREVPPDRWNVDALYSPDPQAPGRTYARHGGFLSGIEQFDADFFGISPRESAHVDPQQRLLLETAHEAVEDAGERWEDAALRQTGVFVGVFIHDYQHMQFADRDRLGAHTGTGSAMSIAANRISYVFDLKGPSVAVDTACSSSLVAVDMACRSLLAGDCDFALAGGVNVILKPEMTIAMSKATMLSREGRCRSFDARADGYVRGEGAGLVLLKRLADVRPRHRVYAIIRGSGVNSDGRTPGISVPNGAAQEALTRRVLAAAGVAPASVGYVEAHGTGTPVGDPIEASALGRVFCEGRGEGAPPLLLGSVKTNIGHLESASGIAGLIKATLCLYHGEIPKNLHFESGNPAIDFDGLKLQVVAQHAQWPDGTGPRRAAVNSFGFGGTNAHVLLEQAPRAATVEAGAETEAVFVHKRIVLPMSARHEGALQALAGTYAECLRQESSLQDLLYTVSQRRSDAACRAAFTASSAVELRDRLRAFAAKERVDGCTVGRRPEGFAGRPVFVFSGMGTQWWGMSRELLEGEPVFRDAVACVDRAFFEISGWSVLEELLRDEATSRIHDTQIAQPALFAVQVGLTALWKHWGVEPAAVVGHSVGEIAALCCSGALSLTDAARVAYHRSRLQRQTAGSGTMLAVNLDVPRAERLVEQSAGAIAIAAINSPTSLTLSGDTAALETLRAKLDADGVFARILRVEVPYHSAKMDPIRDDLVHALAPIRPAVPHTAYYSTTDLRGLRGPLGDAHYWWSNVRQTVLFSAAIDTAVGDGHGCFLELGPHPVLKAAIGECLAARAARGTVVSSLQREKSDFESLATSMAELHGFGVNLAWERIIGRGRLLELPPYPWQRSEHWSESERAQQYRKGTGYSAALRSGAQHSALLGAKLDLPTPTWLQTLDLGHHAYLEGHRIQGSVIFPGAGYLEMALQTLVEPERPDAPTPGEPWVLSDVEIGRALYLVETDRVQLETARAGERWTIHGAREGEGNWVRHASGRCRREATSKPRGPLELEQVKTRCPKVLPSDYAYRLFRDVGLEYGLTFQGIRDLWYGEQECLARVEWPQALGEASHVHAAGYLFHPALLDICLHALFGALNLNGEDADRRGNVFLPVSLEKLRLYRRPTQSLWTHARLHTRAAQHFVANLSIYAADGSIVAEVVNLRCQALESAATVAARREREWLLEYEWEKTASAAASGRQLGGRWLLLAPRVDHPLVASLRGRGAECIVATPGEALARMGDRFTVPPTSPEAFREVLASLFANGETLTGIVHAWCLESARDCAQGAAWHCQELGAMSALHLVQALAPHCESTNEAASRTALWFVTEQTQAVTADDAIQIPHSVLWGLRRVIANEHPVLSARHADLDSSDASLAALLEEMSGPCSEDELAFRQGDRYVHRLRRFVPSAASLSAHDGGQAAPHRRMELQVKRPGDLRSMAWIALPAFDLGPKEVEIEVHAAGVNFKDVMKATGLFPPRLLEGNLWSRETLGMECSGRVTRVGQDVRNVQPGQEVMALAPRAFASHVVTHSALAVPNPGLSHEAAASIPVAFLTACVGLELQARLQPGERVLIHAATGGVGQAALQVARDCGAEVFATAGSEEKRQLLRRLGVEHVFDSRSLRFAEEIREATHGEGVDVVLNSLAGEAITQGLGLLRDYGRFVEIGKMDLDRDFPLGLRPFVHCLSFHAVDLDRMLAQRVETCGHVLSSIHDRLVQGRLHPVPVQYFRTADTAEAFQSMAAARHTGKLVVGVSPDDVEIENTASVPFRKDSSYLVTGGLGGFGFQLALWLAERGAGNLLLLGRRGAMTPGAQAAAQRLRELGASVQIEACDVANAEAVRRVLASVPVDRPLRGVFHAAAVLDDALLKNLDMDRYRKTFAAKAVGAWNLHEQTQSLPLDYFMCFSSMASVLGNQGSANYCAANAFVDALAHHRRRRGLRALTVNWGVIADVGMAADEDFYRQNLERNGLSTIHSRHCLELLELLLRTDRIQTTVCPIDFATWLKFNPAGREGRLRELLATTSEVANASRVRGAEEVGLRAELVPLDERERSAVAREVVRRILAEVLRTPVEKVDATRSLTALGADSLMAIEIKNRLESVGLAVSVTQLLNRNSAGTLARLLLDALGYDCAQPGSAEKSQSGEHTEVAAATNDDDRAGHGHWLQRGTPRPHAVMRLIGFPYAGGGPSVYHRWPESLPDSVEVLTVCLPGRGPRAHEPGMASIAACADALVAELVPWLDRPFALFGHCMGAILMYEVAHRLETQHGKIAARVFASGCMAPHLYNSPLVHEQPDPAFLDVLRLISFSGTRALIDDVELRRTMFPMLRSDFRAVVEYGNGFTERPPLRAPITGLAAQNDLFAAPKAMHAWGRYTKSGYELIKLPGDHYFVESDRDTVIGIVRERLTAPERFATNQEAPTAAAPPAPGVTRLEPRDDDLGQPPPISRSPRSAPVSEPRSGRTTVFCFPGAGIPAREFPVPRDGGPDFDYVSIEWRAEAPTRTGGVEGPLDEGVAEAVVEAVADSVEAAVERAYRQVVGRGERRMIFYGHCLGAIVAYELALRLAAEGLRGPERLVTAGAVGPHLYVAPDAHRLPTPKLLELLRVLQYPLAARLETELDFQRERLALIRADFAVMAGYSYREREPLAIPITAISLRHDLWSYPLRTASWQHHTERRCEVVERDGDHYVTLRHPELVDALLRSSVRARAGRGVRTSRSSNSLHHDDSSRFAHEELETREQHHANNT